MTSSSLHRCLSQAPDDFGLLITFDCADNTCQLQFVPDQHLESIHPNAYGPAALNDLAVLGGGGSGVRVFRGAHPQLGPLVMKHGGYKDTKELFALASIAQDLEQRNPQTARNDMKWRLPEYKMLYISPCHLRETPHHMWTFLTRAFGFRGSKTDLTDLSEHSGSKATAETYDLDETEIKREKGRDIRLFTNNTDGNKVCVTVNSSRLKVVLGSNEIVHENDDYLSLCYGQKGNGYLAYKALVDKLVPSQKKRFWKFTQGQKMIGDPSAKTAISYLSKGELCGETLEVLISEYWKVIRNLQDLTRPEEEMGVDKVRSEVKLVTADPYMRPCDISDDVDAFVGFAIKKNWDPENGRFFILRRMGVDFRANSLVLTKAEKLPCRHLGSILKPGSKMNAVFKDSPRIPTALDTKGFKLDTWRVLLRDAVNLRSSAALKLLWSCGIADGGLHNLFLSSEGMWLFDLGEPTLQPLPAFLTKYLFSYFHGLGMIDDSNGVGWVNRFVPDGKKLALTEETKILTAKAYAAFKINLDQLIAVFFNNEEAVRGLLINYVTLQLLSDAGFCLDRWVTKGGGKVRTSNHHKHIEHWLWRCLWDIYIASDLNTNRRLRFIGAKVDDDPASMYGPAM